MVVSMLVDGVKGVQVLQVENLGPSSPWILGTISMF